MLFKLHPVPSELWPFGHISMGIPVASIPGIYAEMKFKFLRLRSFAFWLSALAGAPFADCAVYWGL